MLEGNVLHIYWREAMSTVIYTLNRVHVKGDIDKTPYELWFGHKPTIRYFKIFGSKCYIKRDEDIGNFNVEAMKEYFLVILIKVKPTGATIRD